MDRSGWTPLERDVLDSLRWWPLDELDAAVGAGMVVHPNPGFLRPHVLRKKYT